MRLAVTAEAGAERVVVDHAGRFLRTGFASITDALAAGIVDHRGQLDEAGLARATDTVEIAEPDPIMLRAPIGPNARVLCVGHNYRTHIAELGHAVPDYPNVFNKYTDAVVGPRDDIELDPVAELWDWEAELGFVVGRPARRVPVAEAASYVAGYVVANDVTARDWQRRTSQWLLGKTFAATTPVGPWLVGRDQAEPQDGLKITCEVEGVGKQKASTSDLVFSSHELLSYLSTALTLREGDLVLTGTPGGVGVARQPVERLLPGQVVTTEIELIGRLENRCTTPSTTTTAAPFPSR